MSCHKMPPRHGFDKSTKWFRAPHEYGNPFILCPCRLHWLSHRMWMVWDASAFRIARGRKRLCFVCPVFSRCNSPRQGKTGNRLKAVAARHTHTSSRCRRDSVPSQLLTYRQVERHPTRGAYPGALDCCSSIEKQSWVFLSWT